MTRITEIRNEISALQFELLSLELAQAYPFVGPMLKFELWGGEGKETLTGCDNLFFDHREFEWDRRWIEIDGCLDAPSHISSGSIRCEFVSGNKATCFASYCRD